MRPNQGFVGTPKDSIDETLTHMDSPAQHRSRIRTNNTIERLSREIKRLKDNWDAISPIFKFSATVRRVIYTTNALELLNSTYRKLNRQRSVFPSDTALLKVLYLTTFEATKRWTSTIRNRAQIHCELGIMYEGRLPE